MKNIAIEQDTIRPVFVNAPWGGSYENGTFDVYKVPPKTIEFVFPNYRKFICVSLGLYDMTYFWPNGQEPIVALFYKATEEIK